jgi:hypothetical protein
MSESAIKRSDLQGKDICFLLDVDYYGVKHRFSTFPIDITDTGDNTTIRYIGGLNDPQIREQTEFLGFDLESNSVPVDLIFYDLDWVAEWTKGRTIDNAECIIYMVTVDDVGATSFTMESRVVLFKGRAVMGVFGIPDRNKGFISFSIENSLSVVSKKIIEDYQILSESEFPDMLDRASGRIVPIVIGKPGPYPVGYADSITYFDRIEATPCYPIDNQSTYAQYIVAYDIVKASSLRIWDSTGGNFVNPVETATDSQGRIYSYVQYNVLGPNTEDNSFFPVGDDDQQFWVQWSEYDGGQLNQFGNSYLTGAGDICLMYLALTGLDYDTEEWSGLQSTLNQYKFAGYINDPETDIWEWLKESIIRFLPIEVINGGKGIKPVLNIYFFGTTLNAHHHIEDSGDFQIITGIQPLEATPVNKMKIRYCYEGARDRFKSAITIRGDLPISKQTAINYLDPIAGMSYERFGLKEEVVEIMHCYDLQTAIMIARDAIRMRGLGAMGIDISAAPKYGYIMLGDVLSLSSTHLGISDRLCQVVAKRWEDNRWVFTIHMENNSTINPLAAG